MTGNISSDLEFEQNIERFILNNMRVLLKAPITASMIAFAIYTLSDSVLKALFIAAIVLIASLFNTWRRFLEPISFWAFLVAVIFWCDPDIVAHLKHAFTCPKLVT